MKDFTQTKQVVRHFYQVLEQADESNIAQIVKAHTSSEYEWFGVHPFNKLTHNDAVIDAFWHPLYKSWKHLQRREDIFLAGSNRMNNDEEWTMSMGHFLGFMENSWVGIPPSKGMLFLRYVEFHYVRDGKIVKSAFFCDMIDLMKQVGLQPLPMQTGSWFLYPGPRTHNGLLYNSQDPAEGEQTYNLVKRMIDDLVELNKDKTNSCPPEVLKRTWHEDMIWFGPQGIGASYTIPRYRIGHQIPFRKNVKNKEFMSDRCVLAEGKFAGLFGFPNLSNTPTGGFLGLPANELKVDMRVVDVYRRDGDKLAENWIFIDFLHWMLQQGVDVIARCREIVGN